MNIKITQKQHNYLSKLDYKQYLFGSRLHGVATEDSDWDYVRVIGDGFYTNITSLGKYFPNIHSWQFDDKENNTQYVWMTETQFYRNLFSGDGNMIADIVLLSGEFENALHLCRTYKIIKGYLGVAKRDLKLHGDDEKKRFHAYRSLMTANILMSNHIPTVYFIKNLKEVSLPNKENLFNFEKSTREILNSMLNDGSIDMYPNFKEENELAQLMLNSNNIREFKY